MIGDGRKDVLGKGVILPHIHGEGLGHLGVHRQSFHSGVRDYSPVSAYWAGQAPWPVFPAMKCAQALLAESVQTLQELGSPPVQIKVVVADLTLILLIGRGEVRVTGLVHCHTCLHARVLMPCCCLVL